MSNIFDNIQPHDQQLTDRGLIRLRKIAYYMGSVASIPLGGIFATEVSRQGRSFEAVACISAGMALSAVSLIAAKKQARQLDIIDSSPG